MLEAFIAGQNDPGVIADLAKRTLRRKIPELTEALTGRFSAHHAFMARLFLDRIDAHTADIGRLDERIEEAMAPFHLTRELLISIPGFSSKTAEVFIAETGGDMSVFPSAGHLASWAGVSPGSNESAGRVKSAKTRPGNLYLKGALRVSAMSTARSKNTFFSAKYQRIKSRRGPMRALVAVEHALIITAWNMLTDGAFYRELGTDYYSQRKPAKAKARAVSQLEALGYTVTLTHWPIQHRRLLCHVVGGSTCGHQLRVTSFFVSALQGRCACSSVGMENLSSPHVGWGSRLLDLVVNRRRQLFANADFTAVDRGRVAGFVREF